VIAGVDELVVGIRNLWLVRACDVVIFGLWSLVSGCFAGFFYCAISVPLCVCAGSLFIVQGLVFRVC